VIDFSEILQSEETRRRTILWLRGTGLNAWSYYGFLEKFSIGQLGQFERIVCVSGGAAVFWLYVLSFTGHFNTTKVNQFDSILRRVMNRDGIVLRTSRALWLKSPYTASQYLTLLRELVDQEVSDWTWNQFPLRNFRVLTRKDSYSYREFGELGADGTLPLAPLLAIGGTPPTGQDIKIIGVQGVHSDFEYAPADVRRAYKKNLIAKYPRQQTLIINTRLQLPNGAGNCSYVRLSTDRWPRLMQYVDYIFLFLGLPNNRYCSASDWSRSPDSYGSWPW
jgi:hypothetical protein